MAAYTFEDLRSHIGHEIECVCYGDPPVNVAVECVTCSCVLFDLHEDEHYEKFEGDEDEDPNGNDGQGAIGPECNDART